MTNLIAIFKIFNYFLITFLYFPVVSIAYLLFGGNSKQLSFFVQGWAKTVLFLLNLKIIKTGQLSDHNPKILASNHVGFLDIPIYLTFVPTAFLAKKSVMYWPVIGLGAKFIGTIFVDRKDPKSRSSALEKISKFLIKSKRTLVIFPEGTTNTWGKKWKWGSFKLASKHSFPLQTAVLLYNKPYQVSYEGNQTFFSQLWKIAKLKNLSCEIKFMDVFENIDDPEKVCAITEEKAHHAQRTHLKSVGYKNN